MKLLAASALLCAMAALTAAAALPDAKTSNETGEHHVVERSASCPCDWIENFDRCFFYVSKSMTWSDAERNCQSMNGNLASVRSLEEYQAIQGVILKATNANRPAWIGGSDAQKEGVWFWSDGSPCKFLNWCRNQPDNGRQVQHCLQMNYGYRKCWDDLGCSRYRPSVCAKKL